MNDLQRIKPIFEQALDREGKDRRAYLDEVCGAEPDLRRKVEALLEAHEHAQGFLESPLFEAQVSPGESPLSEGPGSVIGRYKLLEKIGEGGMAVVYMAEQEQPIRRKIALKIIKLGMDTRQVIARFEAERQALALMDHPSIAKVLDAGATDTGRPYFVMELVQGVSITEYCDKNNLSTKDRLALFVQVCNAVQHAHQKGIIHRDIKPSNVMVTHHDGRPVPKVIDFGIAKATNQKLTEKTLFTRYAHIIGTPAYMSPEQAELSDLDIDTRTDIYSLGVLLYELLTGTTPFSEEELRKAGYIEMQRVIREQEPVKPSTKLSTLRETLTDIAKHRGCTPDLLRKAIRGDLDWIVMKSLDKDRARRYHAAEGLALDIQRHLEHRPVLAHAPTRGYRLHKFLRRHRSRAIAGLLVVVALGAAMVILSVRSRHLIRLAEAEGVKQVNVLSEARKLIAQGDYLAARKTLRPILESEHAGLEARSLFADTLVDGRDPDGAMREIEAVMEEHYRWRIRYYTERIAANPDDPNNYLKRAQQYYYLRDEDKVNADMSRYATVVSKGTFTGLRFSVPRNLGPVINTSIHDVPLWLSSDGLSLWFQRMTSNTSQRCEILVTTRATQGDPWGTLLPLGIGTDSIPRILSNSGPTIVRTSVSLSLVVDPASTFKSVGVIPGYTTSDGLEMYFSRAPIDGGYGDRDLWMMKRETIGADWGQPENLGPVVNSPAGEVSSTISPNGLELYFGSSAINLRSGTHGLSDLWVTKRATRHDSWGEPVNLGLAVNTAYRDNYPVLLGDGLLLFFYSDRAGGYGQRDLYMTRRASLSDSWGPPMNLGPLVNGVGFNTGAYMSADGSSLFFNSNRPGGYGGQDIWQVRILGSGSDSDPNNHTGTPGEPREGDRGKEVVAQQTR